MGERPLCLSPRCRRNPETGAVTPRWASDGGNLCYICTNILGEDALIVAVRYRQLGLVLTGAGRAGEERANRGKPDANLHLNLRAAALRRDIERAVGSLAQLITDQRGFNWPTEQHTAERPPGFIGPLRLVTTPTTRVAPLARFVARSREWLAAHNRADEHAALLRELATGETYRVAFPGGVRKFVLPGMGEDRYLACPETVEGEPCPGILWTVLRRDGDYLPSQVACNHDETHQWPTQSWLKLGRRLIRRAEQVVAA